MLCLREKNILLERHGNLSPPHRITVSLQGHSQSLGGLWSSAGAEHLIVKLPTSGIVESQIGDEAALR